MRVINPWVANILERGGNLDEAIAAAQNLAREAFQQSDSLKVSIDRHFGGTAFRTQLLEPLLQKERELDALHQRVARGGGLRTSDRGNLPNLIERRQTELAALALKVRGYDIPSDIQKDLDLYLDARRRQLYLGDAERVRGAIREFLAQAAIAS